MQEVLTSGQAGSISKKALMLSTYLRPCSRRSPMKRHWNYAHGKSKYSAASGYPVFRFEDMTAHHWINKDFK